MLTESEKERFAETEAQTEIIEMLEADYDLLVSRLCAIAFEAGIYEAKIYAAWDPDSGDFWDVEFSIVLTPEELIGIPLTPNVA